MSATFVAACSTWKHPSDWFGHGGAVEENTTHASAAAAEASPYYASEAGLRLLSEPRSTATTIARLELHQKVYRSKVERGFAFVRVEGSKQVGWVDNAKLIWRLPKVATETGEPEAAEVSSDPPAAAAMPEEAPAPVEAPVVEPAAAPAPNVQEDDEDDTSIFNPF